LVLALWLTQQGARVRIIDKTAEPGTTSRALAVQVRTLELYRQMGFAEELTTNAREVSSINLWVAGKPGVRAVLSDMGRGISPYVTPVIFPQDEHEQLLIGQLAKLGIEVQRRTELLDFENLGDRTGGTGIRVRLQGPSGAIETLDCLYLAGCDGAHSTVREKLQIGFPGGTYQHVFYVADIQASGPVMDGGLHVGLDRTDFLAVFPLKGNGRARLVGTVRQVSTNTHASLQWSDVNRQVSQWMRIDVDKVNWFSTYHVHHRVAESFRAGRVFLLGDAAHIHSPVGGQGMNTGIGDAINLAWKVAAVLRGRAAESILDSYQPERIAFAQRLVATTDQAFTGVTSDTALARFLRLTVVPAFFPLIFSFRAAQRILFRTLSQTAVSYRHGPLSQGRAGSIWGGDRLPWIKIQQDEDNFAPLSSRDWQVHVYGQLARDVQAVCRAQRIATHVFPWQREMARAGLYRDAVYLIRPDGYIAVADTDASPNTLADYLNAHEIGGCL
jgi:2-polyprenyl-6-methoxyphenol hydroxylase-like FAD-dependent oxidoreductase